MPVEPVNSILGNFTAERAARVLTENSLLLQRSLARLSSGLRIVSPSDDPGGLAQSVSLENQITRVSAVQTNVTNATSFAETQSGFLADVASALDRMSELATLSQDALTLDADRSEYQIEFAELQEFISDIGTRDFNGISLFSGVDLNVTIDVDGTTFTMNGIDYTAATTAGGIAEAYSAATSIESTASAAVALDIIEDAVVNLGLMQATVGATTARLDLTNEALSVMSENLTSMNDLITQVNIATESTEYARLQLLVDAGTTMLAEANSLPGTLLSLLPQR